LQSLVKIKQSFPFSSNHCPVQSFFFDSTQTRQLGNLISSRPFRHRKPAMASSSAGNSPPISTISSLSKRFEFSPDPPPKISLSIDQYQHCSKALHVFKNKLRTREIIAQEFAHLQVQNGISLFIYSFFFPYFFFLVLMGFVFKAK